MTIPLPPFPSTRALSIATTTFPEQSLPGTLISPITGLTRGSRRSLVVDAGGRVALSGGGDRLVVGTTASVAADGTLTVVVREDFDRRPYRLSTLTVTVAAYDSATATLLAAFTGTPSAWVAGAYDRCIRSLKSAGLWSALDVFYLAGHDDQASRVNWKLPGTYTGAKTGTLDFVAFKGFKGDGSTGYIATGWNPATNAVQLTANSATLGWHVYPDFTAGVPVSVQDTNFDVGASGSLRGQARAGGQIAGRVNSGNTVSNALTVTTSIGLNMLTRSDVNTVGGSRDGSAATAVANVGAGTLATGNLTWCGNLSATFSVRRISCVFAGRLLTNTEIAAMAAIIETYFREVGTWVNANTRGPGLYSTDATAYGTMSSEVIPDPAYVGTRRFRVNYGIHGQPPGTSGEGIGAYNRITYSDNDGTTYTFGSAVVSDTPAAESVIDPHLLALADGRLLHVYPYNGSGGDRSIWARVLTNPSAAPASWVWTTPAFLGFGFVGAVYPDGADYMFTMNTPLLGQTGDGDYYCRLTFNGAGLPVARIVSLMPNAIPNATLNDYGERILARRSDGSLFVAFRTQSTNYWYSISSATDDGATGSWTVAAPWTTVPNPSARMATALSPTGNRYVAGNNSTVKRANITLWLLSGDMMTVMQSFLLDGRGSSAPSVSYPGIAFKGTGTATVVAVDHDCGRGIQDPPTYTNELLAHSIPEGGMLSGNPTKTTNTVTS